jgi:hypothetical protein
MLVRSLTTRVLKWPNRATVDEAVRAWAAQTAAAHPEVLRIGYFGSYARGDWGVGSDVDLVLIVSLSDKPWMERPSDWDRHGLPVPSDAFVYTAAEFATMLAEGRGMAHTIEREAVWVYTRT